jgi:hypothetical protein
MGNAECGMPQFGVLDCGLRPLRAVGSIYKPEAVGAIRVYAPEGFWIGSVIFR